MRNIKMDLDREKETIRKEVGVIKERGFSPVQVYILCKASTRDYFQLRLDTFMKYLDAFGRIDCEEEDKIDLMFNLINLNFGNFDDAIGNLIRSKGLDPKSVSTILKKEFICPSNESQGVETQRETPGYCNQIADTSQSALNHDQIPQQEQERNIRMKSLGLERDVITQGGPENGGITTSKEYDNVSCSQTQPIEDEQLTDRKHPTSSLVFDQKLKLQSNRIPYCIFCNSAITTTQDHARLSSCNHDLHRGCLINTLDHILKSGSVEMKCRCNNEISESDLKKYLSESEYQQLDQIRIMKFLEEDQSKMQADDLIQCKRCPYKVGIIKSYSYGQCHCGAKYCSECHEEYNQGHQCPIKKPEQICDHIGSPHKLAGVGILACSKCNATLCEKCYKTITTCYCVRRK